jgi:glyoxylase-like metal-dependent hydrolase (beta-lactamase superfamily II)
VRGRDYDLVIDTGMGLSPLKAEIIKASDRPIKAVVTHSHYDHSGSLHEFSCRLGHRHERHILVNPTHENTLYVDEWARPGCVDALIHPTFSPQSYQLHSAPLTGYLDEGDILDLGDKAFQILHTPGHSPGSICLWNAKDKTLFSGDAIYDGPLLDDLVHSDRADFLESLLRFTTLGVEEVHGGHFQSFGHQRLTEIVEAYQKAGRAAVPLT